MQAGDLILSDELNHASIVDGCRLSRATIRTYEHADMQSLRRRLAERSQGKTMIVTDSVFSMEGDLAPLAEIVSLAEEHEAIVMIDDAHATGVLGPGGQGALATLDDKARVEIVVGTLGKALGSIGGFVGGSKELIEYLARRARSFLFTTALPPPAAAAALQALTILRSEPELVQRLHRNSRRLRHGLTQLGYSIITSDSAITPVLFETADGASRCAAALYDYKVVVNSIRPPYVPEGGSRIRTIASAALTDEQIDHILNAFDQVRPGQGNSQKRS
jgi:7-keto-8-aminopelargonate synthetase-like enzyme